MSSYCSAHDEWLIMKLCMYVGYHDANNVSNVGGDPVTQLNFKKRLKNLICNFVFQNMRSAGYYENMIGRTYFGGDQVTQLNLVLYNTIKWPNQPKHSTSLRDFSFGCVPTAVLTPNVVTTSLFHKLWH